MVAERLIRMMSFVVLICVTSVLAERSSPAQLTRPPAAGPGTSSAWPPPAVSGPAAAEGEPGESAEPRGPVLGVEIKGNRRVKDSEVRRHIQTRQGRPYDPHLVQEDLRRLFSSRKFHNVRVEKKVVAQGVFVTFEVVERPTVDEVLFIGNRYASDKRLKKECGLSDGEALNVYTVQEACRKIEDYYHSPVTIGSCCRLTRGRLSGFGVSSLRATIRAWRPMLG
jgi:hypothetical protein